MERHRIAQLVDKRTRLMRKRARLFGISKQDERDELTKKIKAIEKQVNEAGYTLRDTAGGTSWRPKGAKV